MPKKYNITELIRMKNAGEKITMVTSYDFSMARIADAAGINTILVGDSLGMTMQGYEDTLPVTIEEMIVYTRSVVRACKNAFVIVDMPFMSYQVSVRQAVKNAGRLIKETGANAVKLEGGRVVADRIRAIVESGIPVCAHIGMTPQSANLYGGYKVHGKSDEDAESIAHDAKAVEAAGAFMCVLECVPPKLAALITKKVDMITIGIGAGASCSGQVLVVQDMMGIALPDDFCPKFVKRYADLGSILTQGYKAYSEDVKSGKYPDDEHSYPKSDRSDEFYKELEKTLPDAGMIF